MIAFSADFPFLYELHVQFEGSVTAPTGHTQGGETDQTKW